eukprot:3764101-Rhodomonas_salina.1
MPYAPHSAELKSCLRLDLDSDPLVAFPAGCAHSTEALHPEVALGSISCPKVHLQEQQADMGGHRERILLDFIRLVPVIAANMDTTGTFDMAKAFAKHKALVAISKHISTEQWQKFLTENPVNYHAEIVLFVAGCVCCAYSTQAFPVRSISRYSHSHARFKRRSAHTWQCHRAQARRTSPSSARPYAP